MDMENMEPRPNLGEGIYACSQTGRSYGTVTAVAKLLGVGHPAISKRVKKAGVGLTYQPERAITHMTLIPRLVVAYWLMRDRWEIALEMVERWEWPFHLPIMAIGQGQFGPKSSRLWWPGSSYLGQFPAWVTEAQMEKAQERPEEGWDWEDYDWATIEATAYKAHIQAHQAKART